MARTATDRPTSTLRAAAPSPRRAAALAVVWLALAYLGLALGTPHPDPRTPVGAAVVKTAQGSQHLTPREGTRAAVAAERPDPRTPAPPPVPAFVPADVPVLVLRAAHGGTAAPRGPPVVAAAVRSAHRPRAPPAAAA